jgi:hypothetical protein
MHTSQFHASNKKFLNKTQLYDQHQLQQRKEEEREQHKENEKPILKTFQIIIKSFDLLENTTYLKFAHKQTRTTSEPFIFYHNNNNNKDDVKEKLSFETLSFSSFISFNLSFVLLLTILIRWYLILSKFKTRRHFMEHEEKVIYSYFPISFSIFLSKN